MRIIGWAVVVLTLAMTGIFFVKPQWIYGVTDPLAANYVNWRESAATPFTEIEGDLEAKSLTLRDVGYRVAHSTLGSLSHSRPTGSEESESNFDSVRVEAVVGGLDDDIAEVPWLVAIQVKRATTFLGEPVIATETCGGGVYQRRWIVTAAHCLDSKFNEIEIIAGASDLNSGSAIRRVTQRAFIHAGYNPQDLRDDIGVIELAEPLPDTIPDAPWPTLEQIRTIPGITTVTGRGYGIGDDFMPTDSLKKVELAVQDATLRVIRVADAEGRVAGLCQGDSGTPVIGTTDAGTFIVGMVSYTEAVPGERNCTTPGFVAGLISIESYLSSIDRLVELCAAHPERCDR